MYPTLHVHTSTPLPNASTHTFVYNVRHAQGKYSMDYAQDMDGVRMQKLLAGMKDRGATVAVVEASTEALSRGWMQVGRPHALARAGSAARVRACVHSMRSGPRLRLCGGCMELRLVLPLS